MIHLHKSKHRFTRECSNEPHSSTVTFPYLSSRHASYRSHQGTSLGCAILATQPYLMSITYMSQGLGEEVDAAGCEYGCSARSLAAGLGPTLPLWSLKLASAYNNTSTAAATRLVLSGLQQDTGADGCLYNYHPAGLRAVHHCYPPTNELSPHL